MTDSEAGKISLVQLLHDRREALKAEEGASDGDLNSPTHVLAGVLHDEFCLKADYTENFVFSVLLTPDGPFIDWKLHTEQEWFRHFEEVEARQALAAALKRLLGR